ncbi:MAG TPA: CopD family protein [Gammaproteobacteria bacterium]|jgi:uncharacterized membrane protein|nr:CopD family protein [Gammaproteobacteria bacterium]
MFILIALHLLAATVWVGGMFFALLILRPTAAELLESAVRLQMWRSIFRRFFAWVWLAIIILPITGYWMIFGYLGGMTNLGWHINVMQVLGIVMILLYLHLFFAPYKRLRHAVDAGDVESGARSLRQIRVIVVMNLILGLAVIAIAVAGSSP